MFQLLWLVGALLACEEHLHITVGFSLKTDSELGLLCWFEQSTVIEAIIAGFKTKIGNEGPCRHLLVKKYKKFGPPEIRAWVAVSRVRGLNR